MKKVLLTLSTVALSFIANAQGIQLFQQADSLPAVSSYTFNVAAGDPTYVFEFIVKNASSSSISTKVRKAVTTSAGQDIYFCYGSSCYGTSTIVSQAVSIPGGQQVPNGAGTYGIRTEFDNLSIVGTSVVHYKVYDATNSTDSASVVITYNVAATGINTFSNKVFISGAVPNPASDAVNFSYNLSGTTTNASIKIFNALGTLVKTVPVNASVNKAQVDVSDLQEGFYFYTLAANGTASVTRKFIIER